VTDQITEHERRADIYSVSLSLIALIKAASTLDLQD
jgi:hypothetical protein